MKCYDDKRWEYWTAYAWMWAAIWDSLVRMVEDGTIEQLDVIDGSIRQAIIKMIESGIVSFNPGRAKTPGEFGLYLLGRQLQFHVEYNVDPGSVDPDEINEIAKTVLGNLMYLHGDELDEEVSWLRKEARREHEEARKKS